jgi:hypothetical protein
VSWREIEDKNLAMITKCFVKLAKSKQMAPVNMAPSMFNIEELQMYLKATIPPITGEEYKFFENNELIRFYETDLASPVSICDPAVGEPSLLFHEFVFLLARIAIIHNKNKGDIAGKIHDLFV